MCVFQSFGKKLKFRYSHTILIPYGVIERGKINIPMLKLKFEMWNLKLEISTLGMYISNVFNCPTSVAKKFQQG